MLVNVIRSWSDFAHIMIYMFFFVLIILGAFYAGKEDEEQEIIKAKTKVLLNTWWKAIKTFSIQSWETSKPYLKTFWNYITTRVILSSKRVPYLVYTSKKHFQALIAWFKTPRK